MVIFRLLQEYHEGLLRGVAVTLRLCAIIWSSGLVVGWTIGLAGARWPRAIGLPTRIISFLLASTPILLMLYYFHYPVQEVLRLSVPPFYTAAAALSLYSVFAVADLVRTETAQFPRQYLLAARACGLSDRVMLRQITLPLLIRRTVPALLSIGVLGLQSTLFAAFISVDELFRVSLSINAQEHMSVAVFTLVGIFFLAICLPLHGLARGLGRRFTFDISER